MKWRKLPSVTREGKFFYNSERAGTRYCVNQSWLTGRWKVEDSHGASWGDFKTSKQAMRAVERMK
jgi:hypothetical protein